jgi:hypothetical protein
MLFNKSAVKNPVPESKTQLKLLSVDSLEKRACKKRTELMRSRQFRSYFKDEKLF